MQHFYLIQTLADDPAQPEKAWLNDVLTEHSFPCKHLDRSYRPEPVFVRDLGEDVAFNFVDRILVKFARHDLLEALSPEIEQCLQLGSLVHSTKGRLDEYRTLWCPRPVILRSGMQSYAEVCDVCGRLIYIPMGEEWHVLRRDLPDQPIAMTHFGGMLIITEALRARLAGREWQKLDISPLEVREEPLDGFPADLRTLTKEQERKLEFRRSGRFR